MKHLEALKHYALSAIGAVDTGARLVGYAVFVLIGVSVIALAFVRPKPDAHTYQWFMTQTCPKMYAAWPEMTARGHKPLSDSVLFEGCLKEEHGK